MSKIYRSVIQYLNPKRLVVLLSVLYGLYFLLAPVLPVYGYTPNICHDCVVIKIPIFQWSFIPDIVAFRVIVVKITTIVSWLWLHGMVFMLLILERKKIQFQENSCTPDGYEMVQDRN